MAVKTDDIYTPAWCERNKGKLLGCGASRRVYECKSSPDMVIKVEKGEYAQNLYEYHLYNSLKISCEIGRRHIIHYFCPVLDLCGLGKYLIMPKAKVMTSYNQIPKVFRRIFNDLKPSNFGYYRGLPVCVDYGILMEMHAVNKILDIDDELRKEREILAKA